MFSFVLFRTPENRKILAFNSFDKEYQVDRKSFMGVYEVVQGVPLNLMGRTGLAGRGCLGRFGPNHAVNPVVTRWKRSEKGAIVELDNQPVLEVVMVLREDSQIWALPGGMVSDSSNPEELRGNLKVKVQIKLFQWLHEHVRSFCLSLKAVFNREALNNPAETPEEAENIDLNKFFVKSKCRECYKGYVDDPRNTDNAWIETRAINFHDKDGLLLENIKLKVRIFPS